LSRGKVSEHRFAPPLAARSRRDRTRRPRPARHRLRQSPPTKAIKHFTAYDPIAKWTVGKAFNRASGQAAAAFLDSIVADMPFPVKAIQVDGGSEFMAEFEVACQTKAITLYVLPPRSPQMNGAVEAMTTNRLGGVPSSGVIFSVRITYAAGVSGPDLAGTALKPSGSVMSLISTTTYTGGAACACSPWTIAPPTATPSTIDAPVVQRNTELRM
jgi:hypothetical protein